MSALHGAASNARTSTGTAVSGSRHDENAAAQTRFTVRVARARAAHAPESRDHDLLLAAATHRQRRQHDDQSHRNQLDVSHRVPFRVTRAGCPLTRAPPQLRPLWTDAINPLGVAHSAGGRTSL